MASKAVLDRIKAQAASTVAKAIVFGSTRAWRITWKDLETFTGITIPDNFKSLPCTYNNVQFGWAVWYKNTVQTRLEAELTATVPDKTSLRVKDIDKKNLTVLGEFTLTPEQEATSQSVITEMFGEKNLCAAYNDGGTGSGKTVFGLSIVNHIIKNDLIKKSGRFYPYAPILIVTVKNVRESWLRHIERAGLASHLGKTIHVMTYSEFSSSSGRIFYREEANPIDPDQPDKCVWNMGLFPYIIIADEAHRLNRLSSKQSRAILSAFTTAPPAYRPKLLALSATPYDKGENCRFFAVVSGATVAGLQCNEGNFNQWIKIICEDPTKPSEKDAKALRNVFAPYIFSFPRVKWPHKGINSIMLTDFLNDRDRGIYLSAQDRYIEKCEKLGKNTEFGQFEKWIALGQFRHAVEPLRAEQIILKCHEHIVKGEAAPVLGAAFRNTIIRAVFQLINLGYSRSDISIIWGGREEIKKKYVLTPTQMHEVLMKSASGEPLSKHDIKCLETTIMFREDKLTYGETTDAETAARHAKLVEFGLMGSQSDQVRQTEIDRFQNGKSKICLFTLAAGGIGISLDHWREDLLPRIGYFTPTYNGAEFKQALGRLVRRFTLSDTYQYIVGMRGTVEESHVLPLIDKKLRFFSRITNSDNEIVNSLADAALLHKASLGLIRSQEEATRDSDDDDTQLHILGDRDEESTEQDINEDEE